MARYSSDSDSDRSSRHRRKHYRRSRSSSSESSDSSSYKRRSSKHTRSKRRHRTRSKSRDRDRASKSYKSSRGSFKDRDKRRYRSKKSRSYSPDRNRKKARSPSMEKSSSRSSSTQSSVKPISDKPTSILGRDDFSVDPRVKESIIEEINSDSFTPKTFTSSASSKENKFRNVVIDVSAETIQAPVVKNQSAVAESIFHTSIMMDQAARFDKWVKKLYTLRQKAIAEIANTNVVT